MKLNVGDKQTSRQQAFSLIEALIAIGVLGFAIAAMVAFTEMSTRSLASVNQQTLSNQKAGQFASFITQRVRLCNFMTNNAAENEVLLAFDDDTDTDSDSDGNAYNDRDHYERLYFEDSDDDTNSFASNKLMYSPNTNQDTVVTLVSGGVKYLPNTNLFVMADHPPGTTNGYRTLHVNVGFYQEEGGNRTQTIEVRTSAFRRN